MERSSFGFWHQRLDVYRVALEFVAWVASLPDEFFRGRSDRKAQLARAADSVPLNIAEGSCQRPGKAQRNHYRIALASAGECDAILEILEASGRPVAKGRALLAREGPMLSRMR